MYFLRRQTPRKTRVEIRIAHCTGGRQLGCPHRLSPRDSLADTVSAGETSSSFLLRGSESSGRPQEMRAAAPESAYTEKTSSPQYGASRATSHTRRSSALTSRLISGYSRFVKIPRSAICVLRQPSIPACLQILPAPERRCSRARANISCLWRMSHCATNAAARETRSAHRQPERHIPHFPYNRTLRRFRTGQSPSRWGNGGNPPRISRSELSCS